MDILRTAVMSIACTVLLGCSGGGEVIVTGPKVGDVLAELEEIVADARGAIRSAQSAAANPRPRTEGDEPEELEKPELVIRTAVQSVARTARQLAQTAAGRPAEADAKAILAEAEQLEKRLGANTSPAEVLQGLDLLSTMAAALRSKL